MKNLLNCNKKMRFKKQQWQLGPNPDANLFIDVHTKNGWCRRRRRGTVKPAKLNESFQKNKELTALCSPAAKRIVMKLMPWMEWIDPGYLIARMSGRLKKAYNQNGKVDFSLMKGLDMQSVHTLDKLVSNYSIKNIRGEVEISIPIIHNLPLKAKRDRLTTNYIYELVVLMGDPLKQNGLRVEGSESRMYKYGERDKECKLSVVLPVKKQPWMALLKLTSYEKRNPNGPDDVLLLAKSHNVHGMRVVMVGE
jgi:hypothetical protein